MKKLPLLLTFVLVSCNSGGGGSSSKDSGGAITNGGYSYSEQNITGSIGCVKYGNNTYGVSGYMTYSISNINPIAYIQPSGVPLTIQIATKGNCNNNEISANPSCEIIITGTNSINPTSIGVQINGSAGIAPLQSITVPKCPN